MRRGGACGHQGRIRHHIKSLIRVLMRCADRERSGSISSSSTTTAAAKGPHRFFVTHYHPSACAPLVLAPFRRQPMISTNLLLFLPSSMSQPGRLQGHHQYIRNGRRYRLSDHFHFTTAAQQLRAYWVGSEAWMSLGLTDAIKQLFSDS